MVAHDTICAKASGIKELHSVVSSLGCHALTQADEECGINSFTNGTACFCVLKGGLCKREHGTGFDVYERKDLVEVADGTAHAPLIKVPPDMEAVHVEVTLKGVSYERIQDSATAESLRQSFAMDVATATGVSASSVWDKSGATRQVSLEPAGAAVGDDFLSLNFNMHLPEHGSANRLTRDLNSVSFQESLRDSVIASAPHSITGPVQVLVAFGEEEPSGPFRHLWMPLLLTVGVCFAVMLFFVCGLHRHGVHGLRAQCEELQEFQCGNPLDGLCDDTESDEEKLRSPKTLHQKSWSSSRRVHRR